MRIDARFNGPPDSAHGGVACGVFASSVDPRAATVRLSAPPPLDTDLTPSLHGGTVIVRGPDGPVAEVRPTPPPPAEPLPWLPPDEVERSRAAWFENIARREAASAPVFSTCFGCGHARRDDDGLELYAAAAEGMEVAGSWWEPDHSIATDGFVDDWAVWAAVDCPSGGAVFRLLGAAEMMLLGELGVRIHRSPEVGERYQVVARCSGRDRRRLTSEVAVVASSGEQLALGRATWILLDDHGY